MEQQDWDQWKHNEVTEFFFKYLSERIEEFKDAWSKGGFSEENEPEARITAQTLDMVRELDYSDMMEAE